MSACFHTNDVTCTNCNTTLNVDRLSASISTWNGAICYICGVRYLGVHSCGGTAVSAYGTVRVAPERTPLACAHCWCDEASPVNGKPHVACCMCGTRRVAP